jgi:hypothetical protein
MIHFQDKNYTAADNADLAGKQATLVSGTNIKTLNGVIYFREVEH